MRPTQNEFYLDGTLIQNTLPTGILGVPPSTGGVGLIGQNVYQMRVGARYDGAQSATMKVAEVVVYDTELTTSEITTLSSDLASKWGIS